MSGRATIAAARAALVARILDGAGEAPLALRRAAFDHAGLAAPWTALVDKVVRRSHQVDDDDISAVRAAGESEDRILEVVICAALGPATRAYDAALAALDATGKD